jgi:hypothetical protein
MMVYWRMRDISFLGSHPPVPVRGLQLNTLIENEAARISRSAAIKGNDRKMTEKRKVATTANKHSQGLEECRDQEAAPSLSLRNGRSSRGHCRR